MTRRQQSNAIEIPADDDALAGASSAENKRIYQKGRADMAATQLAAAKEATEAWQEAYTDAMERVVVLRGRSGFMAGVTVASIILAVTVIVVTWQAVRP